MKLMKHVALVASMLTLGSVATVAVASPATQDPIAVGKNGMMMGTSYQNDVSLPLYYLPSRDSRCSDAEAQRGTGRIRCIDTNHSRQPDPVIQHTKAPTPLIPAPILNFNGIPFPGVGCNCAPPDTNGEVGETQYVQMVNEGFQVFDKATGTSVLGPQSITSVWAGFGGVCETARRRRPGRAVRPDREPLADQPVRRRRASRPTSASRSRRRAMRPAPGTATRSISARTSSTTRISACGRTATTWRINVFNSSGTALPRPAGVRVRSQRDAGRHAGDVRDAGHHRRRRARATFLPGRPRRLEPAAERRAESVRRVPGHGHVQDVPLPRRLRDAGQLDVHAVRDARRRPASRSCAPATARAFRSSAAPAATRSTASAIA